MLYDVKSNIMDSFEINKIVASILLIALLFIGIGKISDLIFHVEKPKTPGYKVELPEEGKTTQISEINKKLQSLRLFKSVKVKEKNIENNLINIDIEVEEQQTGTVNAGVSVGTIDGFSVVAGLSERNFYGTGRSVDALLNTSDKKTELSIKWTINLFWSKAFSGPFQFM